MRLCTLCKKLLSDDRTQCPDHPGAPSSTQQVDVEPLPPELAARFPQHEAFALGSSGTLYRLRETNSVLKVLHASLTRDATERARYRRELRRQQNLIHPQLPRVHDLGESEHRVWFTRDFIEGESLAVRLREERVFESAAAYSIIVQLSAALDALHQLGLVHRDLKPGHVLSRANRSPRESLQLIDATVAGLLTADEPRDSHAARHGTPDYAANELIEGAPATFRSDLYALGCLSYELLAGAPPFRDATGTASGDVPDELPEHVPEAVRSLITSMLAKDAHRRPFSAQQVRRALEPHIGPANAAARSASLNPAPPPTAAGSTALRLDGPAAKPVAPATFPDATVELDVEDLDEAIQVTDEPEPGKTSSAGEAAATQAADVDDSAPTIALNTLDTRAIMSSMLPAAAPAKPQPPAADPESASRAPTHAPTGTKFGLGPVRPQDIEAAKALAADLKTVPLTAADIEVKSAPPAAAPSQLPAAGVNAALKRYSMAAKPLAQSPRLLLWAAAGLIALIALLRVVLGPSAPSVAGRSPAVVVQVPGATPDTGVALAHLEQQAHKQFEQLSEEALIGGNIPRPPQLTAAQRRHAARANQNDQVAAADSPPPATVERSASAVEPSSAEPSAQSVAAVAPAQVKDRHTEDAKNVPTVSAGSVRGGLARAASTRPTAAASTRPTAAPTNISAVNANDSPDADYKAKGRALFKAGKYTEAVEAYQRATKRDNGDASAFAGLGGSLLAKGETRRAITAYQRAVRLQPEVSGFQAALGRAYLQQGDRVRARAAYSKALALDPNNQAARSGMANAKAR